jgi:pyruvate,orthophosphate dikinase
MGKPAVVGAADLTVDIAAASVRAAGRTLPEGTLITIDGTSGEIVVGSARITAAPTDPHLDCLLEWADEAPDNSWGATSGDTSGDKVRSDHAERLLAADAALRGVQGHRTGR